MMTSIDPIKYSYQKKRAKTLLLILFLVGLDLVELGLLGDNASLSTLGCGSGTGLGSRGFGGAVLVVVVAFLDGGSVVFFVLFELFFLDEFVFGAGV